MSEVTFELNMTLYFTLIECSFILHIEKKLLIEDVTCKDQVSVTKYFSKTNVNSDCI